MTGEQAEFAMSSLRLQVAPLDAAACDLGMMRPAMRLTGLSLVDGACRAPGGWRGLSRLTADRAWEALDLGARVEAIR